MGHVVKKTGEAARGLKRTPKHVKFVAWDDSRPANKYVYALGAAITWGPNYKKAKRFDSTSAAREQLARISGIDPETFQFGSVDEGTKPSKIL